MKKWPRNLNQGIVIAAPAVAAILVAAALVGAISLIS